jgi:hypothetical protein
VRFCSCETTGKYWEEYHFSKKNRNTVQQPRRPPRKLYIQPIGSHLLTTQNIMQKIICCISIVLLALWVGCRKNEDDTKFINGPIPTVMVEATLVGRVINENGVPISIAQVVVGNKTYSTNDKGVFLVKDQQLDQNGTLIKVYKNGYFTGYRFTYPQLGSVTQVDIVLRQKIMNGPFESNDGGTYQFESGTLGVTVDIPPNAIATEDGTPYNGTVNIALVAFDPTSAEDMRVAPGDLRAQDANAQGRILQSFGMFGVELTSPDNTPLNLRPDTKAKIKVAVPEPLWGQAPAEIPLWHFNEANGYWEEEGTAKMDGNNIYVAQVSHFSFWNCDVPADYCFIKGRVVDGNGVPVSNAQIIVSSSNFGQRNGYTDNAGFYYGLVPANESLEISLADCLGGSAGTVVAGPFATNSTNTIPDLVLSSNIFTFQGQVIDCNGQAEPNAIVQVGNNLVVTDTMGKYQFSIAVCGNLVGTAILAQAYVLNSILSSGAMPVAITSAVTTVPALTVCNSSDEYVLTDFDGISNVFTSDISAYFSTGTDSSYIYATGVAPNAQFIAFGARFMSQNVNDYQLADINFNVIDSIGNNAYAYCKYCGGCDCGATLPVNFTQFPTNVGDYAEGSFSGMAKDEFAQWQLKPFTVTFRVKRDQ